MEKEEELKAGDVVKLKTGVGPMMVIEYLHPDGKRADICWYFPNTNDLKKETLYLAALRK